MAIFVTVTVNTNHTIYLLLAMSWAKVNQYTVISFL